MNANANNGYRDVPDEALRWKIEERAYYSWLASGSGRGNHQRRWLEAERELMEATKRGERPQSGARSRNKTAH